jgi:tRNA pseudouridine55 synthase
MEGIFQKGSTDFDFSSGKVILVDKPLTWTSFDAVKKVRGIIRVKKVGHAGTLDPLATGLIILCTGKFTKKLTDLTSDDKEYTGSFYLGATRPSFDKETEVDQEFETAHITEDAIYEAAKSFTGDIEQTPPIYSAVKIGGEASYKKARRGEAVVIKSRTVTIREFEITKIEMPVVHFRVACSKGTYIRTLANDFGKALGSGAYLDSLHRTRSGEYLAADAWDLAELSDYLIENKALILEHANSQGRK